MHRFSVPHEPCPGTTLALGDADRRHAVRVLRLEPDERIEVLDGAGTVGECRVVRADREAVEVIVEACRRVPRPPRVVLAPSLLKGKAMDLLVQKATELGVSRIRPLETERSVVRIGEAEAEEKRRGWVSTAIEACKQCGNPWLPVIDLPVGVNAFLDQRDQGLLLVASLRDEPRLPGEILAGLESRWEAVAVTVVTGPEGDLTEFEYDRLAAAGGVSFTLGPLVLRGETAAIASLAILQHELRRRARGGCGADGAG